MTSRWKWILVFWMFLGSVVMASSVNHLEFELTPAQPRLGAPVKVSLTLKNIKNKPLNAKGNAKIQGENLLFSHNGTSWESEMKTTFSNGKSDFYVKAVSSERASSLGHVVVLPNKKLKALGLKFPIQFQSQKQVAIPVVAPVSTEEVRVLQHDIQVPDSAGGLQTQKIKIYVRKD